VLDRRVPRALACQLAASDPAQAVVDERKQFVERGAVAVSRRLEQLCDAIVHATASDFEELPASYKPARSDDKFARRFEDPDDWRRIRAPRSLARPRIILASTSRRMTGK